MLASIQSQRSYSIEAQNSAASADSHIENAVEQMRKCIPAWARSLGASRLEAQFRETLQSSIGDMKNQTALVSSVEEGKTSVRSSGSTKASNIGVGFPSLAKPMWSSRSFDSETLSPFGNIYSWTRVSARHPLSDGDESIETIQEDWEPRIRFVPSAWIRSLGLSYMFHATIVKTSHEGWKNSFRTFKVCSTRGAKPS